MLRNNTPAERDWIGVTIAGPRANRQGIGARLELTGAGGLRLRATVRAQASFESTNDARVIFRIPGHATELVLEAALPGVATVTAGPGVTNTITAVRNARLAQSPLVLLAPATTGFPGTCTAICNSKKPKC